MVDDDTYCIDVLTQVSAATKALQSVAVQLLDDHLRHCVAGAVQSDDAAESTASSPRPPGPSKGS
jgi:DNA-binding FrmR family transcriptional regulator